ncbi:MAG: response regulator [Magnetococcales bacterium]|nr:response regulator [Magnetococcales bacterium]
MKRPSIVVVDDNPDLVELVQMAFDEYTVDVSLEIATNGRQALELLLDEQADHVGIWPPKMVLLDLDLPDIGGLEVLAELRRSKKTSLLPIVILTTSNNEHDVVKGYQLGANSFIRKPHLSQRLFEVVRELGIYWLDINRTPTRVKTVV